MYDETALNMGWTMILFVAITHIYLALTGECLGFMSFRRILRVFCHLNTALASFACAYLLKRKSRTVACMAFISTLIHCGVYVFLLTSGDSPKALERALLVMWLPAVLRLVLDSDLCRTDSKNFRIES